MGWDYFARSSDSPKGAAAVRAYIRSLIEFENESSRNFVLALEKVGSVWFAAVRRTPKAADEMSFLNDCYYASADGSYVMGVIVETKTERGCLGYQVNLEVQGSNLYGCPDNVLRLLSETTFEQGGMWAAQWRASNMTLAKVKAAPEGSKLILSRPAAFAKGKMVCEVVIRERKTAKGSKRGYYAPEIENFCLLPDWRLVDARIETV